jgi:hypothetical protein
MLAFISLKEKPKDVNPMKKNLAILVFATLLAGVPALCLSQLPSIGGLGSKLPGASAGGDLSGQQVTLVRSYVAGGKDVLFSQSKLLEALGLKDQAATAQATANSLSEGSTTQNLQDADKVQSANSTAISDALKNQNATLDAQSKQIYAQGLTLLAAGLIKYTGMRQDVAGFSKGLAGPGALQAGSKLQSGAFIIKTLPGSISNTTSTLNSAVSFAKSHGIEVPPDATAALTQG